MQFSRNLLSRPHLIILWKMRQIWFDGVLSERQNVELCNIGEERELDGVLGGYSLHILQPLQGGKLRFELGKES